MSGFYYVRMQILSPGTGKLKLSPSLIIVEAENKEEASKECAHRFCRLKCLGMFALDSPKDFPCGPYSSMNEAYYEAMKTAKLASCQ
jgi:hypothetical protein